MRSEWHARRGQERSRGAGRGGASGPRDRRHRLERLRVEPLERRAGEGVQPGQCRADRINSRSGLANAQTQIDVATFTQWVDAYAQEQTELADFYFARFRPEFKPAIDAWVATRPLRNPDPPLTPFAMPEYQLAARKEAAELAAQAETLSAAARENVQRATNYVLAVVLFATALFFGGMAARFRTGRLRLALLSFGVVILLGTVAWIATFPVSISV
jgi:hypothetical protein